MEDRTMPDVSFLVTSTPWPMKPWKSTASVLKWGHSNSLEVSHNKVQIKECLPGKASLPAFHYLGLLKVHEATGVWQCSRSSGEIQYSEKESSKEGQNWAAKRKKSAVKKSKSQGIAVSQRVVKEAWSRHIRSWREDLECAIDLAGKGKKRKTQNVKNSERVDLPHTNSQVTRIQGQKCC